MFLPFFVFRGMLLYNIHLCSQLVPHAGNGDDIFRLKGVLLDLLPEMLYVDVDDPAPGVNLRVFPEGFAYGNGPTNKVLMIGIDGTMPSALAVARTPNLDR